ncbi:MAG: bacterioferritin [Kofleriaceae bacterium]|jgi:bacterioferritin|nr:bacterioferritin [Kofleriaceae bacterium]MBP9169486.1 bacterioferritin [Kofleriaceae bacterium]MBP9862106.1 bacterioferritin [Kofleriaceae bacterium]
MKGQPAIIDLLNELLTNELTAINQYFIHAKMCENWGYRKLAAKVRAESIDEMKHADEVITRILFLEGVPNLQRLGRLKIGETVPEQFEADLALEYDAIGKLNGWIATARQAGDNGTEDLLSRILVGEEAHTDWLETQVETIKQIGVANYLAQQLG